MFLRKVDKVIWLDVLGFNTTLRVKVISMAVGDAHVFPGFLTPLPTQLSFQSPDFFSHMFQLR